MIANTPASTNARPIPLAGRENSLPRQNAATVNTKNPRQFLMMSK
jgi:hypothetical protein